MPRRYPSLDPRLPAALAALALAALFLALPPGAGLPPTRGAAPARKPNVLIFLSDDQGYGDFGCLGHPVLKTPNFDKLHRQSIRLTDFHVSPMCTPTRGQIMSGRDALANGAMNVSCGRSPLRAGIPTMANVFAANGYRTGHFGKWHLGDNYPYRPQDRGFEETYHCRSWGMASAADHWNNQCFDDWFWHNGKPERLPGYNTDALFSTAMKWMKACHDKGEPFFVYLPTTAVHGPLWVPDKYRTPYRQLKRVYQNFFAMIANLDENMGKLDAFLTAEGLADDTVLIFMTDNGGTAGVPFYNAGMRGHKTDYYEGGHRTPCWIRWPHGNLRPAGDLTDLAECQDLLPTLIDLCGLEKPRDATFDGADLAPYLRGEQDHAPERMLVVQYSRSRPPHPHKGDACVMWHRWRLVQDKELYDLRTDPGQKDNVLDRNPEVVRKMREHYDRWWAGVEKRLDDYQPIHLGSDAENPTRLAPCDWQDVHCDQSVQVREGVQRNAPWNVFVEKDGEYEVSLWRWPPEADLAITAASPPFKGVDGRFPAGVALPIAKARLTIGKFDVSQPVREGDKAITFTVTMAAGRKQLHTWFYDRAGKELCGAYYTVVRRK